MTVRMLKGWKVGRLEGWKVGRLECLVVGYKRWPGPSDDYDCHDEWDDDGDYNTKFMFRALYQLFLDSSWLLALSATFWSLQWSVYYNDGK